MNISVFDRIEKFYLRLPKMPSKLVDLLVSINSAFPKQIGILGIIFSIIVITLMILRPDAYKDTYSRLLITFLTLILSSILLIKAAPYLKNKEIRGWKFLVWIWIIGVISSFLQALIENRVQISVLVGLVITPYILYQIKPRYQ